MADAGRRVAVGTGAGRGVGRGIAAELSREGFDVFATGRTVAGADLPRAVRRVSCDHTDDDDGASTFEPVRAPLPLGVAEARREHDLRCSDQMVPEHLDVDDVEAHVEVTEVPVGRLGGIWVCA